MVSTNEKTLSDDQVKYLFAAHAVENRVISEIEIENTNFEDFGNTIFDEMRTNSSNKLFSIQKRTTEVIRLIIETCKSYVINDGSLIDKFTEFSNQAAERLNRAQVRREESSPNANPPSDGGLTTFFNPTENNIEIFLAKLDIETYLERMNVRYEKGFPIKNRTQKSCIFNISITEELYEDHESDDSKNIPIEIDEERILYLHFNTILVSDSNSTMAKFWHEDFLELKEHRTDLKNTETAFNSIKKFLKRKLRRSPADYNSLLNHTIGYFETNDNYRHEEMVEYVLNDYVAKDSSTNLESLKSDLTRLPESKLFDTHFTMDKSKMPKATSRNFEIDDNIFLTAKNHIENMDSKISAIIDPETDSKTLIIRDISERAYNQFKVPKSNID